MSDEHAAVEGTPEADQAEQAHAHDGHGHGGHGDDDVRRRDFMTLLAGSVAAVGIGAFVWPFIDSLSPPVAGSADAQTVDVDLGHLAPGQQMSTIWRGKPILIMHRTDQQLLDLQNPNLTKMLIDPASQTYQQPSYAVNWHRSILAVLFGAGRDLHASRLRAEPGTGRSERARSRTGRAVICAPATDRATTWPGGCSGGRRRGSTCRCRLMRCRRRRRFGSGRVPMTCRSISTASRSFRKGGGAPPGPHPSTSRCLA